MPFSNFGLEASLLKAVQQAGYTEPTPIQSAAIPLVLAGHDLIGIAQTGTGMPVSVLTFETDKRQPIIGP